MQPGPKHTKGGRGISQIVNKQTGGQISSGGPRVVKSEPRLSENVHRINENGCILIKKNLPKMCLY